MHRAMRAIARAEAKKEARVPPFSVISPSAKVHEMRSGPCSLPLHFEAVTQLPKDAIQCS